ncbi:MAG: dihydroorotate dehydrogenase [Eubacteriales bacterium]|nr:dihydroorotate dehydrogenase [Eubacteriales bacterium]
MYKTDLSVCIGSLTLRNPIMPASGTYEFDESSPYSCPPRELGAVVVKSVHRRMRSGNPVPRIVETPGGVINSVGIPSVGMERFLREEAPKYARAEAPVVLSLAASHRHEYGESLSMLEGHTVFSAIELNLSCPNVGTGLPFSADAALLEGIVREAKEKTKLPIFVKLSPNVTDILSTARAAQDAGADAIVVANTYRAMSIDIRAQRPALGNISGGMSGPAVKAQTMYLVYRVCSELQVPVIASGGAVCWEDAVEYILAGAYAVQIGCGNFLNPLLMKGIVQGIDNYLSERGYTSLAQIRGKALCGSQEKCERSGL